MVTVEVDQELREAVNAASDAEFRTVAAWVRIAIREKLQRTKEVAA